MRFPTSGGTGRNQWPCSEADNTALVRLLKLYAPMLPQRADSDAALDFREEGDDGEEAGGGGGDDDAPEPVRVLCRLMDAEDPWNQRGGSYSFYEDCLLYTSPSPRDKRQSRMPSSA